MGVGVSRRFNLSALAAISVILAIAALAVLSVLAGKLLFSDGPYHAFKVMARQDYWLYDRARAVAHAISQTPPVVAMKLGERNVIALVYLHTIGLIVPPAILWMSALALHLRSPLFWVLLLGFSVTHLTSGFCSLGEYNMAYAFAALCVAVMLRPTMGWLAAGALLASALALTRCFEATVFLGPVLAVVAIARLVIRGRAAGWGERIALTLSVPLFAAGAAIAARSILHPRDPGNLSNALSISWMLESGHVAYVLLMLGMVIASRNSPPRWQRTALVAGLLSSMAFVMLPSLWSSAIMSYSSRTLSGALMCVVIVLAVAEARHTSSVTGVRREGGWPEGGAARFRALPILSAMLFVALLVPAFVQTWKFGVWLKRYETIALAQSSWVPIDETGAGDEGGYCSGFAWAWTNPSLSIVLRADSSGGLLNRSDHTGWQPFDPRTLPANPLSSFTREGELLDFGSR